MTCAPVPGWYPDPYDPTPGALRWYDGQQWTSHLTSLPAQPVRPAAETVATPAMSDAATSHPPATAGPGTFRPRSDREPLDLASYPPPPAATAYQPGYPTAVMPYGSAPTSPRPKWLIPLIAVAAIVVLGVAGSGLAVYLGQLGKQVSLATTAPPSLLGRPHLVSAKSQQFEARESARIVSPQAGYSHSLVRIYGGSNHYVVAGWATTSLLLEPGALDGSIANLGEGIAFDDSRHRAATGPYNGTVHCRGGREDGEVVDVCAWSRDRTGLVFLIEYGSTPDAVLADLQRATGELAKPGAAPCTCKGGTTTLTS